MKPIILLVLTALLVACSGESQLSEERARVNSDEEGNSVNSDQARDSEPAEVNGGELQFDDTKLGSLTNREQGRVRLYRSISLLASEPIDEDGRNELRVLVPRLTISETDAFEILRFRPGGASLELEAVIFSGPQEPSSIDSIVDLMETRLQGEASEILERQGDAYLLFATFAEGDEKALSDVSVLQDRLAPQLD